MDRNFAAERTRSRAMTFDRLLRLVRTPLWIGGLVLVGLGASIHIVALGLAPLTVVQPVGILAVPFSILLATRIYHTRTTGRSWLYVLLTVLGIVVFTILSATSAVDLFRPHSGAILRAGVIVFALSFVLALVAWRGPRWLHCLAWAWAGAVLYGLGSAFIKIITITWGQWSSPRFYGPIIGLILAYAIGGWMIQQAYAAGPAEVVVGVMTTVDPVVAVVFGLTVLGEGSFISPPYALGMLVSAAAASCGVFLLSKDHPEAIEHRREAAEVEAAAAAADRLKG